MKNMISRGITNCDTLTVYPLYSKKYPVGNKKFSEFRFSVWRFGGLTMFEGMCEMFLGEA